MKKIEPTYNEARDQCRDRNPEHKEQEPEQISRFRRSREQIEPQTDQCHRDRHQRDQSDQPIENHGQQRAGLVLGGFFEQQVALNNIAAGAPGQELVVKHANQKKTGETGQIEADLLDAEQNLPSYRGRNFDDQIRENRSADPSVIGGSQRDFHLLALIRIVKYVPKQCERDPELNKRDEDLFHAPKCCFQVSTERWISSAVLRGLISQTHAQSFGKSGTSFARSTSPLNGG